MTRDMLCTDACRYKYFIKFVLSEKLNPSCDGDVHGKTSESLEKSGEKLGVHCLRL